MSAHGVRFRGASMYRREPRRHCIKEMMPISAVRAFARIPPALAGRGAYAPPSLA